MAAVKSESLMIRISPEVKAILQKNSSALGMTMSEYARLLILEDARKTIGAPSAPNEEPSAQQED